MAKINISNGIISSSAAFDLRYGSTDVMTISSSQHVGIGITQPQRHLHIDYIDAQTDLIAAAGPAQAPGLMVENSDATGLSFASFDMRAYTGDIRIAAQLPAAGVSNTVDLRILLDSSVGGITERLTIIGESGFVGMGSTNPTSQLHLHGNNSGSGLRIDSGDNGTGGNNVYLYMNGHAAARRNEIVFQTSGSTKWVLGLPDSDSGLSNNNFFIGDSGTSGGYGDPVFNITSANLVGIGTTNPTAKLSVYNSISTTYLTSSFAATPAYSMLYLNNTHGGSNTTSLINFRVGTGDGVIGFVEGGGTNDADFVIQTDGGSNGIERLRILNNGDIGIGIATPAVKLEVRDSTHEILRLTNDEALYGDTQKTTLKFYGRWSSASPTVMSPKASISATHRGSGYHDGSLTFYTYTANVEYERMRISYNGDVGIGTTNPSKLFDVYDATDNAGAIIQTATSAKASELDLKNPDQTWALSLQQDNDFALYDRTAGIERISVKSGSGYVGIGTTAPATNLEIYGTAPSIRITDTGADYSNITQASNGGILSMQGADGVVKINLRAYSTGTQESYFLDQSIGIGTASPATRLHVESTTNGLRVAYNSSYYMNMYNSSIDSVRLNSTGIGMNYKVDALNAGEWSSAGGGRHAFYTTVNGSDASTEKFTITASGSVGIGITNPTEMLHVSGSGGVHIIIDGDGTNNTGIVGRDSGTSTWAIFDDYSDNVMRIVNYQAENIEFSTDRGSTENVIMTLEDSSGYVGIGTTNPSDLLHMYRNTGTGDVRLSLQNAFANSQAIIEFINDARQYHLKIDGADKFILYDATAGLDRFVIDTAGHIGIGTATPGNDLHLYRDGADAVLEITSTNDNAQLTLDADSGNTASGYDQDPRIQFSSENAIKYFIYYDNSIAGLAFNTSATTETHDMFIKASNGYVGIGTSNPLYEVSIENTTPVINLAATSAVADGSSAAVLQAYSGSTYMGGIQFWPQLAGDGVSINFRQRVSGSNTNVMTINNGNVGIGSTTPVRALEVNSTIRITTGTADTGRLEFGSADSYFQQATDRLDLYGYNGGYNHAMTWTGLGSVGIGTTTPAEVLHVYENIAADAMVELENPNAGSSTALFRAKSDVANAYFGQGSSGRGANLTNAAFIIADGAGGIVLSARDAAGDIKFYTNGTETNQRMIITDAGFVGIGITAPTSPLYVNGSDYSGSAMVVDRLGAGGVPSIEAGPSNPWLMLEGASGTGAAGLNYYGTGLVYLAQGGGDVIINGGGNVGIGTTQTAYRLGVEDSFNVFSSGDTASPKIEGHLLRVTDTTDNNGDIDHFFVENHGLNYGMRWHYDGGTNLFSLYRHNASLTGNEVIRFNRDSDAIIMYGGLTVAGAVSMASVSMSGDLTVGGKVTAQEFHAEFVSSSIIYESGSTKFGNSYDDTHDFTGSINLLGNGEPIVNIFNNTYTDGIISTIQDTMVIRSGPSPYQYSDRWGNGGGVGLLFKQQYYTSTALHDAARISTVQTDQVINSGKAALTFQTGDGGTLTEKMRITHDGNVGIGTTNPLNPLHIYEGNSLHTAETTGILVESDGGSWISFAGGTTQNAGILFPSGSDTDKGAIFYNALADSLTFRVNAGNHIVLNSSGYVGIGRTNPNQIFQVQAPSTSTYVVEGFNSDAESMGGLYSDAKNASLYLKSDGALTKVIIRSSGDSYFTGGDVGIGTATPASNLHVHGTLSYGSLRLSPTSTNGESAIAFFTDTNATTTATAWVLGHAPWSNTGDFVIGQSGAKFLIESGSGNVGIGTTSPGYLLDLATSSRPVLGLRSTATSADPGPVIYLMRESASPADADELGAIYFDAFNSAAEQVTFARIRSIAVDVTDATEDGAIRFDTTLAGDTSHEAMRIVGKNLGIGLTGPTTPLEIVFDKTVRNQLDDILTLHATGDTIPALYGNTGLGILWRGETYDHTNVEHARIYTKGNDSSTSTLGADLRFQTTLDNNGDIYDRMTIRYDGKVGIGTTTPTAQLHVVGSTGITIENTSTTNIQLLFRGNGIDNWRIGQNLQVTGGTALEFYDDVNNLDRMVITNAGYVGIGTTNPITFLHVTGSISGNIPFRVGNASPAGYSGMDAFDETNTNALSLWHANSAAGATNNRSAVTLASRQSGDPIHIVAGQYDPTGATNITLLATSGNVGIGITNPDQKLEVWGPAKVRDYATINSGSDEVIGYLGDHQNMIGGAPGIRSGSLVMRSQAEVMFTTDGSNLRMIIDSNGYVGIGTTLPYFKTQIAGTQEFTLGYRDFTSDLHIHNPSATTAVGAYAGAITFGGTSATGATPLITSGIAAVQTDTDSEQIGLAFFTHPSSNGTVDVEEAMRITAAGYVGIGITNPGDALSVYSSINDIHTIKAAKANRGNAIYAAGQSAAVEDVVKIEQTSTSWPSNAAYNSMLILSSSKVAASTWNFIRTTDTAGNGNFVVRGDGRVGVGTTSPAYELQVAGNADVTRLYVNAGGNATDPIIRVQSDTNTGIYFPSDDQLALSAGAVETMITYATGTVFNETGLDLDFRIESADDSNFFVIDGQANGRMGFGTAVDGAVKYKFGGTHNSYWTGGSLEGMRIAPTVSPSTNGSAYGLRVVPQLVESSTGTAAKFVGLYVDAPGITTGAATLTEAASVYINGAPTAGTANYSLHVNSGNILLGGAVTASAGMTMTGDLYVDGFIRSTQYKAFYIDTPTGEKLEHMALEGPEPDVYFRGQSSSSVFHLPEYWKWLVDEDSITVQVTPVGEYQKLYVDGIFNNQVRVLKKSWFNKNKMKYNYIVHGKRKDINA